MRCDVRTWHLKWGWLHLLNTVIFFPHEKTRSHHDDQKKRSKIIIRRCWKGTKKLSSNCCVEVSLKDWALLFLECKNKSLQWLFDLFINLIPTMKNVSRMGPEDYAWNVQTKLLCLFRCSSSRPSLGLPCLVRVHFSEAMLSLTETLSLYCRKCEGCSHASGETRRPSHNLIRHKYTLASCCW